MGSQQRDAKLLGGVFDLPAAFYAAAAAGTAALETQREELAGGEEGEGLITIREVAGAVAGEDGVEEESTSASRAYCAQNRATCFTCGVGIDMPGFETPAEQRIHFRSDWHRCNLKRKVKGQRPLSEGEFENMLDEAGDDVESISGSDTDSDDEDGGAERRRRMAQVSGAKVIFSREDGTRFSLWRCLLEPTRRPGHEWSGEGSSASVSLEDRLSALREGGAASRWMVVLASGGHFAAAIFQWRETNAKGGNRQPPAALEVVLHKTFHKYVVRAKAGGRQSTKDGTGKSIKSAGSALRRANEASLAKDIRATLESWKLEIAQVGIVFVHSSRADTGTLFVGDSAPLSRSDPRLRRIPFPTRRPTLAEVKRVAVSLASVWELEPAPPEDLEGIRLPSEEKHRAASPPSGEQQGDEAGGDQDRDRELEPPPVKDSELHLASRAGRHEEVRRLLEQGANPCQRDARGRLPYDVAPDKATRDAFRRFMAAEPAKWDYAAAGVPSALTAELEEQQEAKKAEKDAKRKEKEKERKKAAKERKKAAEEEAKAAAAAEIEAAAAAAAAQASRLKLGDKKKPGSAAGSKKVGDADKRRELMAAAAEARMKALAEASKQQKLW